MQVEDIPKTIHLHVRELKRRILISLLFFITILCITFNYAEILYQFIAQPLIKQNANSNQFDHTELKMIYTAMGEGFMSYLKISLYASIFVSIPFWLLQIYRFIAPGLLASERKVVLPCFILSPLLFYLGSLFLYYVAMPLLWKFFLSFQNANLGQLNIILYAKIAEYLSLVLSLALAFGFSFQLPVVVLILTSMGLVNCKQLRNKRKYAIVLIFVVAAILTPPDVISQVCLAIPLLMLYELSILLSKIFVK